MSQLTNYKVALERRKNKGKKVRVQVGRAGNYKMLRLSDKKGKRKVEHAGVGQAVERLKRVASGRAAKNTGAASGVIG
jgi:hypothetical protein